MTVYKVLTERGYDGHEKGEEFEADLTEAEEQRLVSRGALEVVEDKTKPRKGGKTSA